MEVGPRNGSCAAAIFLQRQVVVAEIARDALWEHLRAPALTAGIRACWSTPIRAADGRMLGTVALHFRQPRSPLKRDFELMARLTALAGIAIDRKHSEEALRRSEARYRGLFENVIEGVYRTDANGRLESANPALVEHARVRERRRAARAAVHQPAVRRSRGSRAGRRGPARGRHGAQRGIRAAPTRRTDHHRGRERPRAARRRWRHHRLRRHAGRHQQAQGSRDAALRGEGEGGGDAAVDRRRGAHGRCRWPRRVPEPGRRGVDRMDDRRGAGPPGWRGIPDRQRGHATAAGQPDPALPARRPHRRARRAHAADQPQAAGDLDPGLGGPDPRPRRHADRRRHGLPRREPGTAAAARADLPGHARPADRAHQPPRIRDAVSPRRCRPRARTRS